MLTTVACGRVLMSRAEVFMACPSQPVDIQPADSSREPWHFLATPCYHCVMRVFHLVGSGLLSIEAWLCCREWRPTRRGLYSIRRWCMQCTSRTEILIGGEMFDACPGSHRHYSRCYRSIPENSSICHNELDGHASARQRGTLPTDAIIRARHTAA